MPPELWTLIGIIVRELAEPSSRSFGLCQLQKQI
jgi:hypothetical protein